MLTKRLFWLALSAVLAIMGAAADSSRAQINLLPDTMQRQLREPNVNVAALAIRLAQSDPQYATALLQAAIDLLGTDPTAAADVVSRFAALAQSQTASDPALAAALAVAVENVIGNPQNAALVGGTQANVIAAAKSEVDLDLQNTGVQQAILNHAPGTQGTLQAAADPGAGPRGGGLGNFGPPTGGSPSRP